MIDWGTYQISLCPFLKKKKKKLEVIFTQENVKCENLVISFNL